MKTQLLTNRLEWMDAKNVSRTTVNKDPSDVPVTEGFKIKLLISEHSPIRLLNVRWRWEGLKSWVATHFSRHKWECFISTQRSDRTGFDRDTSPQNTLVNFEGHANAQHLIDTARKRLCYQSAKETRDAFVELKTELMNERETSFLGFVLVPNCIYRMGCPEFEECFYFEKFMADTPTSFDMNKIVDRYRAYNYHAGFRKE